MGLAVYNNYFVDMPLVPACYKVLLGQEPNLLDMHQWQPETAKSLQFILDYGVMEAIPLEDIVCRNFTVDLLGVDAEGRTVSREVELVLGGAEIPVTIENREQFVRLFVEFEFKKQCKG